MALLLVLSPVLLTAQTGTVIGIKPDKIKHFAAGAFIAGTVQTFSHEMGCSRTEALLLGFGAGCLSAAGKELYDMAGHGTPSLKDAFWTCLGVSLTSVTLRCTMERRPRHRIVRGL